MSEESRVFYSKYQADEDFSDFWKRNLSNLVNCRSLREVMNHKGIDVPIKIFFCRDTFGYFGRYFTIAERRGPLDFVISDTYPTVISGVMDSGMKLEMYSMFPISPERVLLLASEGVQWAPGKVAVFSNEVRYVDSMLVREARKGFAFRVRERVPIMNCKS